MMAKGKLAEKRQAMVRRLGVKLRTSLHAAGQPLCAAAGALLLARRMHACMQLAGLLCWSWRRVAWQPGQPCLAPDNA